jgi:5'-methylthioadenosine phosphorylase
MTNLGEAKCAREAEIAYATAAMVTDYDCWNDRADDHVTVDMIVGNLHANAAAAKRTWSSMSSPTFPAAPDWA